jgi:hypothetical protein
MHLSRLPGLKPPGGAPCPGRMMRQALSSLITVAVSGLNRPASQRDRTQTDRRPWPWDQVLSGLEEIPLDEIPCTTSRITASRPSSAAPV